jgi:tetratricopeptide (TPR) repeat protein
MTLGAGLAGTCICSGLFVMMAGVPSRAAAPPGEARAPRRMSSTCVQDDPVPTPKDYAGWDRSSVVAWEAIQQYGGVVPDIEEDRSHAPPAWWRYPSALRSAELLSLEAADGKGLYSAVARGDLKQGDILVRAAGAGACGKMAMVVGQISGRWMTMEADGDGSATRSANPLFFDGDSLRAEVGAYRVKVKKDETLGHVRELGRDLEHLERTIAERPPLLAKNGRAVVDEKVHDLLDEAWSLTADASFDLDRRALAGRALALGAALDWPGAAAAAAAVLDDVLRRAPLRADAVIARAMVHLLSRDPDKAALLGDAALAIPAVPARAHYVLGRALLAGGRIEPGLSALRKFLERDPGDPRAQRLVATGGAEPKLAPAPPVDPTLIFTASPEHAGLESGPFDFRVEWPLSWRVVESSSDPDTGAVITLNTGRVLLEDGDDARGTAVLLAQRPDSAAARAAIVKKAGRNIFPEARLKPLTALLPGSRREQFREKAPTGGQRQGEVTTIERGPIVYFLVLNAPAEAYPKLKDAYAALVKSLKPSAATPTKPTTN